MIKERDKHWKKKILEKDTRMEDHILPYWSIFVSIIRLPMKIYIVIKTIWHVS